MLKGNILESPVASGQQAVQPVTIYTDGACHPNPGKGGFGAILIFRIYQTKPDMVEITGGEIATTNNRMEMLAAIHALRYLEMPRQVRLFTDSKYMQKGMTAWVKGWKKNNWHRREQNGDLIPVKNADLWQELDRLCAIHDVKWFWVRGHNGTYYNEIADRLADKGREEQALAVNKR